MWKKSQHCFLSATALRMFDNHSIFRDILGVTVDYHSVSRDFRGVTVALKSNFKFGTVLVFSVSKSSSQHFDRLSEQEMISVRGHRWHCPSVFRDIVGITVDLVIGSHLYKYMDTLPARAILRCPLIRIHVCCSQISAPDLKSQVTTNKLLHCALGCRMADFFFILPAAYVFWISNLDQHSGCDFESVWKEQVKAVP